MRTFEGLLWFVTAAWAGWWVVRRPGRGVNGVFSPGMALVAALHLGLEGARFHMTPTYVLGACLVALSLWTASLGNRPSRSPLWIRVVLGLPVAVLVVTAAALPIFFPVFDYVSSLHDGMNLVAKEFVSVRDDEQGVLLLSRFAGASRELTEALVVNPYDLDGVADTLLAVLDMPAGEQRERMRAMRRQVATHNVYRWAGRMLLDASRVRQDERVRRNLTPC